MARKTRSPEVVEKVKQNIIEEAMKLIIEVGFFHMSMRKLADRVGMSATNLYYYYSNRDEIYLNIQIKGFKALQEVLEEVYISQNDPFETLKKMIRVYLEFGFNNPDYYQIMLNSDTPRYLEYRGDKAEPVALETKQAALNALAVPMKAIEDNAAVPAVDVEFRAYQLWITLHGIVTLYNRNILAELNQTPEKLIIRLCEELMLPFYKSQTTLTTEGIINGN
ncbi:TetR/AcrR family transcriptional regulator [bacterium]|nr:TetR/AcrR family transcriptional regulator [bacterium]